MNGLITMILRGAIHASIVAMAMLVARLCVARSAAAGRSLVGAIGMACILAVTAAAALPLPGFPSISGIADSAETNPRATESLESGPTASKDPSPAAVLPSDGAQTSSDTAAYLPLAWLSRVGRGVQRATSAADASPRSWRLLLLILCALGVAAGLGRLAVALQAVQNLRRKSEPVTGQVIAHLLKQLAERADYRQAIDLRQTDRLTSAAVFGWRQPVIVLPRDWREWTADELSAVLAHEVAHIVRGDFLQRLVALAAVAVHFYHPLVRWAAWRLAVDQEFAADRLARGIAGSGTSYGKGLARLALRYHNSLQERRVWPSVSVVPRSSDFLARRLEMLRVKNDSIDPRSTRWTVYGLCGALVAVALTAAFIRGAAADDQPPAPTARPIETARLPDDKRMDEAPASAPAVDPELFSRAAFDPAMLRANKGGGFLIRVGDMLRHPEIQPHVESINAGLIHLLHDIIGEVAEGVDLREIEWMAGDLRLSVTSAVMSADPEGEHGRIMLGSGGMIIRTTHARDWQAVLLEEMPGTSLKTFEGKSYVQLPSLPAIGPVAMKMRSPNDHTIIYATGTKFEFRSLGRQSGRVFQEVEDFSATLAAESP
ncbi:MAG TPA: M56 family metallopeptidase [Pirellulales bacterium]|nr:M56 family metallopeptidase [Pirellulales bacterium]